MRFSSTVSSYLADPRREWDTVLSRKCEKIARNCSDVADVGEQYDCDNQYQLHCHPLCRHALFQDVDDGVRANVLQSGINIRHCKT